MARKSAAIPSRERILEAASAEFAAHGYAGARIGRIAHGCHLNVRMLYYHFASKEGLYRAVLRDLYERMAHLIEAAERAEDPAGTMPLGGLAGQGPGGDPAHAVSGIGAFERYCDLLAAEPRFADILVRETLDGARRLKAFFDESPELFARVHLRAHALVRDGIDAGLFRPLDPALTVLSITGMVTYLTAMREVHRLLIGTDLAAPGSGWRDFLTDLVLRGLAAR